MNRRCRARKMTMTGRIIMMAAALVMVQSRLKRVAKL